MNKEIIYLLGMPRAGNTLLASLVNQNKDITVTALSPVVDILYQIEQIKKRIYKGGRK